MAFGPAVPEVSLTFGLIMVGIACAFLIALNRAYGFTLGALLTGNGGSGGLAGAIDSLPHVRILGHDVPPWNALADAIRWADSLVVNSIGSGIIATEKGLHAILGWMAYVWQATAEEVANLADETWKSFGWVKGVLIPAVLGAATIPIWRELRHLTARTRTIVLHPTTIVHKAVSVVAPGLEALTGRVRALEAKVAAIGAEAPAAVKAVPAVIEQVPPLAIPGDITRGIDSLWKRVRRIGRTLTPAGIVGLVAAAVGTMGLTWTRCSKADRWGKNVCGMDTDLLDSLLADTLLILGTVDLVEFAEGMQTVTSEMESLVASFWRA